MRKIKLKQRKVKKVWEKAYAKKTFNSFVFNFLKYKIQKTKGIISDSKVIFNAVNRVRKFRQIYLSNGQLQKNVRNW